MTESFTYPDHWQFRIDFYGAKWESYRNRFPNRWPTKRTIRQWVKECNEAIRRARRKERSMTKQELMDRDEFLSMAKERFGDKVIIAPLNITEEVAAKLGLTREAVETYPEQAWIPTTEDKGYLCPNCGHELGGLFGSFTWGLQHGVGTCSACDAVRIRYYHYVMRGRPEPTLKSSKGYPPLQLFALVAF